MQYLETVVKTPKEVTELSRAISSAIIAVYSELKDGFDLTDLPNIIAEGMEIATEASDFAEIAMEIQKEPGAVARLVGGIVADVLDGIVKDGRNKP